MHIMSLSYNMGAKLNCTTYDNKRLGGLIFYRVTFLIDVYMQILCTRRLHTLFRILRHLCSSCIKQPGRSINAQCCSVAPSTSQVLGLGATGWAWHPISAPPLNGAFHSNGISQICGAYKSAKLCFVQFFAFTKKAVCDFCRVVCGSISWISRSGNCRFQWPLLCFSVFFREMVGCQLFH